MTASSVEQTRAMLDPRSIARHALGACLLDGRAFRALRDDPGALAPATVVVLLAGAARGIGAAPAEGSFGLIASPLVSLVFWAVGAVLVWGIATRHFGLDVRYVRVLRTLGFAAAPLLLLCVCAVTVGALQTSVWVAAHGWSLISLAVAVREALDVSQNRALVVLALALVVTLALLFILGLVLALPGP
jgi:hypothetical protein